jgi:hypothetical protein
MSKDDDRRREAGEMIAKHNFGEIEATRSMVGGSVDPGKMRQRMQARGERADDLETYDEGDAASEVAKIMAKMKKAQKAMELAGILLDAEMDAADNSWN